MGTASQTRKRLEHTPFKGLKELKSAEDKIQSEEWHKITRARKRKQLLAKPENLPLLETFEEGIICQFHNKGGDALCQLSINHKGKQTITIAPELENDENKLTIVNGFIHSASSVLHTNYLKTLGVLNEGDPSESAEDGSGNL